MDLLAEFCSGWSPVDAPARDAVEREAAMTERLGFSEKEIEQYKEKARWLT
ncbi:MAG: hypothetical protein ACRDSJ_00810 [Rubrobacteraceae bacterium]